MDKDKDRCSCKHNCCAAPDIHIDYHNFDPCGMECFKCGDYCNCTLTDEDTDEF